MHTPFLSRAQIAYIEKPFQSHPFDHALVHSSMAHFSVMEDLKKGGERISEGEKGKDIKREKGLRFQEREREKNWVFLGVPMVELEIQRRG
ncbi:hypothetical protein VNO80_00283 [Phaseolus coccineus]|uniref:Uncharacterized protein n=1 Tax=Phaseolus coccineus TaxID=3886 RepID=A0AAN9NZ44_PHACN